MITKQVGQLITVALITGFIGDAIWQIIANMNIGAETGTWGLQYYFERQGSAEALFTAAGMLGIFYILYAFTGLPFKVQWITIYAVILDLIFRYTNLFPSLKMFYKELSIPSTIIMGSVIPLLLPLFVYKFFNRDFQLF
jgi:hypothetical protein